MVDVEERPLGAFEQDVVAAPQGVLDEPRRVGDVRTKPITPGDGLVDELVGPEGPTAPMRREQEVLVGQDVLELGPAQPAVEQVLHPEADAPGPIGIGRADPPPRRADLAVAEPRFHGPVEGDVVRHDHVGRGADADAARVDPPRRESVELADQRRRVDHDSAADDRRDVRVQDPRRHQVELEDLVAADDRVAGVVAALVADDHRDLLGEEVGGLALALVAPLQPDDHGSRH